MAGFPIRRGQMRLLLVEDMPQVVQSIRSMFDAQTRIRLVGVLSDASAVVADMRGHQRDDLVVDALPQGRTNGIRAADVRRAGLDLRLPAMVGA